MTSSSSRANVRRLAPVVLAALFGAAFGTITTALAADQFVDVPDTHPFHDEIGWMGETGISTGFPDGTYRPSDPVTRQAMSAFMQRLFGLRDQVAVASDDGFFHIPSGRWFTTLRADFTVPVGTTATVLARYSAITECEGPGWCTARMIIDGIPLEPHFGAAWVFAEEGDPPLKSFERYAAAMPPGDYEIEVQISAQTDGTTFRAEDELLVVETILDPPT